MRGATDGANNNLQIRGIDIGAGGMQKLIAPELSMAVAYSGNGGGAGWGEGLQLVVIVGSEFKKLNLF